MLGGQVPEIPRSAIDGIRAFWGLLIVMESYQDGIIMVCFKLFVKAGSSSQALLHPPQINSSHQRQCAPGVTPAGPEIAVVSISASFHTMHGSQSAIPLGARSDDPRTARYVLTSCPPLSGGHGPTKVYIKKRDKSEGPLLGKGRPHASR